MLEQKDDEINNRKAAQSHQTHRILIQQNVIANQTIMLQHQAICIADQYELIRSKPDDILEMKDQLEESRIALRKA